MSDTKEYIYLCRINKEDLDTTGVDSLRYRGDGND